MIKLGKLEDFIKSYINNKVIAGEISGYGDYILKTSAPVSQTDSFLKADTAYRKALSGYGKNAERLFSGGLGSSGYAEYLDTFSKNKADLIKSTVKEGNSLGFRSDYLGDYESYLKQYIDDGKALYDKEIGAQKETENKLLKNIESATEKIIKNGILDYQTAYDAFLNSGVGEDAARENASKAISAARVAVKAKILDKIIDNKLSKEQAKTYALEYGLTEDEAEALGETARKINQTIGNGQVADSYLDYLREQEKKKKQ